MPLAAGLINYKRLDRDSKWIFYLTIAAVPPQILTSIVHLKETPALNIFYNLYTPVEFILMYRLFWTKYIEMPSNRVLFKSSALLYAAVSVYLIVINGISRHFLTSSGG